MTTVPKLPRRLVVVMIIAFGWCYDACALVSVAFVPTTINKSASTTTTSFNSGFRPQSGRVCVNTIVNESSFFKSVHSRNIPVQAAAWTSRRTLGRLYSSTDTEEPTAATPQHSQKELSVFRPTLALLTFDLDDTLYPLDIVIDEANAAFARSMEKYGFSGIRPHDINLRSMKIRSEMSPEAAMILTHTQLRKLAIRAEMEQVMLQRKLEETAIDWATNVESLGRIVVENAKKWSTKAVSSSIVDAVLTAWEMERHHAAERHLYPEVIPALKAIKKEYPNVVIGAVTDGKANPLFMTFTLGKYFDFCANWEDDQGGRRKFFQELSKVEGNAELTWIYNEAYERGRAMSEANAAITRAAIEVSSSSTSEAGSGMVGGINGEASSPRVAPILGEPGAIWIHVGDDLAYDVGGSAQCGAKTVLVELADKYGQTARHRFDPKADPYKKYPSWSMSSQDELDKRAKMNEAAKEFVNEKLEYWHLLPEVINKIVQESQW